MTALTAAAPSATAYRAPWWLPGGNVQTIYSSRYARRRRAPLRQSHWNTPDGDIVRVDFLDGPAANPLVCMFHGLEGSAASHYVVALAAELHAIGWRMVVPHWRGCGGIPNIKPRAYHSGDSDESDWMLERAGALADGAPLFAVGASLGGNVLLKWLGERGERANALLRAGAAISAPVDLAAGANALERGFNRLYTNMFLQSMRPAALARLARFPGLFDVQAMRGARTLRDFDNVFTAPLHGFAHAEDYWARASSKPFLRAIAVPTLMINAWNDPFLPGEHLPTAQQLSTSVTAEFPRDGGHVGFANGAFPADLRWLPLRIIEFFRRQITPRHDFSSRGNLQSL